MLTGATSTAFRITVGAATQLVFTTQPGGGADGATWTTQPAVERRGLRRQRGHHSAASITLASGPTAGGTLACTTNPLAATDGVATFAGCHLVGRGRPATA